MNVIIVEFLIMMQVYVEFIGDNTLSGITNTLAKTNCRLLNNSKQYSVQNRKMEDILKKYQILIM